MYPERYGTSYGAAEAVGLPVPQWVLMLGLATSELAGGADPIEPISNCGIGPTSHSLGALVQALLRGLVLRAHMRARVRLVRARSVTEQREPLRVRAEVSAGGI